jgi:MYXO-CTERM domain-containing protein
MRLPALTTCSFLAAFSTLLLAPDHAEACGGTFCDTGPNSMPVEQTGENILFVFDGTSVEAHIQIQYDPNVDADKFAWVIPVLTVPEFEVGSDLLFQNLLAGTVPTYGFNDSFEGCGNEGTDDGGEFDGTSDTDDDGDTGSTGEPDVVFEDVVGAFEIAVLQGGTIEGVMQWLGDNGYQQDPAAMPVLGEYLGEGYLFVALKLAMNTEVAEIHPIILRQQSDESCVPLRLTRIAAVEDMDVRVFVLGAARAVPSNYRHVLVNPLMINWVNFATNYKEVVAMAVDAFAAEGNAFVTEYAGNTNNVSTFGIHSNAWNGAAFAGMQATPELVIDELASQGLVSCEIDFCEYGHPLIKPLLSTYLPVPDGVIEAEFYGCLSCFAGLIDAQAWSAAGFAQDFDERIVAPGVHAIDLLESWPYLTRMFTTISPNEMTVDPIFVTNDALPEVTNIRQGTRFNFCEGGALFTLPDGREVYLPDPQQWPDFGDQMPWEEDVEQAAMVGPNQNLSDRTVEIDALLAAWNQDHGWPPSGDGDGDGTTDGDGSGTAGESGTGDDDDVGDDANVGEGSGDEGPGVGESDAACACSSEGQGAAGGLASLALLGLGAIGRRRRRE